MNYFLDGKINRAEILFPGVACFLIAVCLGSSVHSSNAADNKTKLNTLSSDQKAGVKYVSFGYCSPLKSYNFMSFHFIGSWDLEK